MQLLYPAFLVFGFVLLIPILIHLFDLRKFKVVYYSDTTLLQEVVLKTKKKRSLRKILILFVRLLIFSCLLFSFCYPYFNKTSKLVNNQAIVYLDNSKSVDVDVQGEYLFNNIKETVYSLGDSYSNYNFLSNDVKVFNSLLKTDLLELVRSSKISVQQLLSNQLSDLLSFEEDVKDLILFSPFSKSIDLSAIINLKQDITLVHFDALDVGRLQIDTLWVEKEMDVEGDFKTVFVEFDRFGKEEIYELKLFVNDELRGTKIIGVEDRSSTFKTHFINSTNRGVVKCYNGNGIELSSFYFVVRNNNKYKVSLLDVVANSAICKAFNNDDEFRVSISAVSEIDYEVLFQSDMVFLRVKVSEKGKYKPIIDQLLKRKIKVCVYSNSMLDRKVFSEFKFFEDFV